MPQSTFWRASSHRIRRSQGRCCEGSSIRKNDGCGLVGGVSKGQASGVRWNLGVGSLLILSNLAVIPLNIGLIGTYAFGVWAIASGLTQLLIQADLGLATALILFLAPGEKAGRMAVSKETLVAAARQLFKLVALGMSALSTLFLAAYYWVAQTALEFASLAIFVAGAAACIYVAMQSRFQAALLQSRGRFDRERQSTILGQAFRVVVLLAVVPLSVQGWGASLAVVAADLGAVIVTFLALRISVVNIFGSSPLVSETKDWRLALRLVRFSLPAFVSSAATLASIQTPLIVSGLVVGFHESAILSVLVRLYQNGRTVIGWVTGPSLPIAAQLQDAPRSDASTNLHEKSMVLSAAIACMGASAWLALNREVLHLLVSPLIEGYDLVGGLFAFAIALHGSYAAGVVIAIGMGKVAVAARINLISLALGLALSIVLGLKFGLIGLASATLLAVICTFPFTAAATGKITGLSRTRILRHAVVLSIAIPAIAVILQKALMSRSVSVASTALVTLTFSGTAVLVYAMFTLPGIKDRFLLRRA